MATKKPMKLQSVIFKKTEFTKAKAKSWLKRHKLKTSLDEKPTTLRARQKDPSKKKTFRTITFTKGIKGVIAK
jgi:hypothetical protein